MSDLINGLKDTLTPLFRDNGIVCDEMGVVPLLSGANNRHYCVSIDDQKWMVKEYFTHVSDSRDRLTSEWQFLEYAHRVAPTYVAKPFFYDTKSHVTVFEWVEGKTFENALIDWEQVTSAIHFFTALNQKKSKASALSLPKASESCFSLDDHIEKVMFRISDLAHIVPKNDEEKELQSVIRNMQAIFNSLRESIRKSVFFKEHNHLSKDQYCLSPSDFGFHNALQNNRGQTVFVDFEYAGWDDPAKMACDFFSQIKIPISNDYFEPFLKEVMPLFPEPSILIERALLIKPVYLIKWCCIVLNVFLPQHLARRQFADEKIEIKLLQQQQLKIARTLLEKMNA